ncbi:hypothetical protein [Qipengyuania sp. 902]|uniref:hypothetical protein n=1 Tax=Qipengyuania sp. 902 TaxID=3417565 RepID=UPI003EBAFF70
MAESIADRAPLAGGERQIHPPFTAKNAASALKALDEREQKENIVLIAGTSGGQSGFSTSYPRPVNSDLNSKGQEN